MVKIYVCNGFFDGSDSGSECGSALYLNTIYRFAKTYILQVAITYIFSLQQPTFWFCNFLHFYFTTNSSIILHKVIVNEQVYFLNILFCFLIFYIIYRSTKQKKCPDWTFLCTKSFYSIFQIIFSLYSSYYYVF